MITPAPSRRPLWAPPHAAVLAAAALAGCLASLRAGTLTVTSTADAGANTLRQAVIDASGGDIVQFDSSLSGQSITLLTGELFINKDLTIDATALPAGLTLDGNGSSRIFAIASGTEVLLDQLTIANGRSLAAQPGGGILNAGNLTVRRCTVSGNATGAGEGAGAGGDGGPSGSGGGLHNSGTLILEGSTVSFNATGPGGFGANGPPGLSRGGAGGNGGNGGASGVGGGISNTGTLILRNSSLSGNATGPGGNGGDGGDGAGNPLGDGGDGGDGGDAGGSGGGGGIHNTGTLTLESSTLSGNTVGSVGDTGFPGSGGVGGSLGSDGSTGSPGTAALPGSGGGVSLSGGSLDCTNTIVAGNSADTDPNLHGSVGSGSNNLIDGAAMLSPLGDYGGPTPTMPPLAGSPAIDPGGTASALPTDQRGYPRLSGGSVDIGAVEIQTAVVLNNNDDGPNSLRHAAAYAPAGVPITFAASLSGQTITLTSGQILLRRDLEIDASALPAGLTLDASGSGRIFECQSGHSVLTALTLTGGDVSGPGAPNPVGGAVLVQPGAALDLERCTLTQNSAGSGGAIANDGSVALTQCTLAANSVTENGGGIFNQGILTLTQSTVSGNSTASGSGSGGGVFNAGSATIDNSIVAGNTANTDPNLSNDGGTITPTGVNLTDGDPILDSLGNYGGSTPTMPPLAGSPAIDPGGTTSGLTVDQRGFPRLSGGSIDVGAVEAQSSIVLNTNDDGPNSLRYAVVHAPAGVPVTFDPSLSGQQITLTSEQINLDRSLEIDASALAAGLTISGNNAGRVFFCAAGTASTLTALTLTGGNAGIGGGGAIVVAHNGSLELNACTLFGNSATAGGGLYNRGHATLNQCTLSGNTANDFGGGIWFETPEGSLTLNQCTLSGNSAGLQGGGIDVPDAGNPTLNLHGCILAGNTAGTDPNLHGTVDSGSNNLIDGNAMLAPLGLYGGTTPTRPPLAGSPAIDPATGNAGSPFATDQRGAPRLIGSTVDIGAVEAQPSVVLNTDDDGPHSLRNVCAYASPGGPITFDPSLSGRTITLTSGQIPLRRTLDIDASDLPAGLALDGNGGGRILDCQSGGATLTGLTLTGGTGSSGGAISVQPSASLTLDRCTLFGNSASRGGAIHNAGFATLSQCTLSGNSASSEGGGIYNDDSGEATFTLCTLSANSADLSGGGIYNLGAASLGYCIVAGNAAGLDPNILSPLAPVDQTGLNLLDGDPMLAPLGDYGGATRTMPPLTGSPAVDPAAGETSSALATDQRGAPRVVGTHLDFGAVEAQSPIVLNTNDDGPDSLRMALAFAAPGTAIGFDPSLSGQSIILSSGDLIVDRVLSVDASALPAGLSIDGDGNGRILDCRSGSITLTALTLTGGDVGSFPSPFNEGGAVRVRSGASVVLNACTLSGNSAVFAGGILNEGSTTLNQCTLSENFALFVAGGIGNTATATLNLSQSTLSGNSAGIGAGGIYNSGIAILEGCIVAGNTADIDPNFHNAGGTTGQSGVNLTSGDPLLAPLGDYGGPTPTMIPLAGSPAIDPEGGNGISPFVTDQRGLTRAVGVVDIGAVEVQSLVVLNNNDDGSGSLRRAIALAAPGSAITFDPSLAGQTVTLASGELAIDRSLSIDGSALPGGITLDANGNGRILNCQGGINTVTGLTLTGGNVNGSGSPGNAGGAIVVQTMGSLSLNQCTLAGNAALQGGGMANYGVVWINKCTLAGNSATFAGGIHNLGTATLNQCTLAANSATFAGGGIGNDAAATLALSQCTVSANSAGISVGGLYNSGIASIHNSIVAGNTAGVDADIASYGGAIQPTGINLTSGDPMLDPLGDYGGPTPTMPPRAGSPAIDPPGGDTTSPFATDQRGLVRVIGGIVDIGAIEAQAIDDLALLWLTDDDGDGIVYGLEQALGTDPNVPDPRSPFDIADSGTGERILSFSRNPAADPRTIWIVTRSPDLSPGSFAEIFRFDGTVATNGAGIRSEVQASSMIVTDENPPADRAFYRFEAEFAP